MPNVKLYGPDEKYNLVSEFRSNCGKELWKRIIEFIEEYLWTYVGGKSVSLNYKSLEKIEERYYRIFGGNEKAAVDAI